MELNIRKKADQNSKTWAGGETTELFIWPHGSDYGLKNFDFRISTATVEVDESVFTPLPGVSRTLMVLAGKMDLVHENQHQNSLAEFDVDCFEGDWLTRSFGRCVDFNVMTRNGAKVRLEGINLIENEIVNSNLSSANHTFIYLYSGLMILKEGEKRRTLESGDFAQLILNENNTIQLQGLNEVKMVWVFIEKK